MLLQCSNISSNFQPMRSTVLPCWTKTFQNVRLEPELLLCLPEFQPSSRVANSRNRSFSLSRTLLPLSSSEASIESARRTMGWMRALLSFLPSLEASAEGRALLPRETWENGWNSCRFLTPVVKKLTNAILRIILYPTDRVTGWVIDYIVTDFVRNRMIRIYEKDVFSFVAKAARKKKLWVLQNAVEPMSFWLLVQMLYHWATRYS